GTAHKAIQKIGNNKRAQANHNPPEQRVVLVQQCQALGPQYMQAAVIDAVPEGYYAHEQPVPDQSNNNYYGNADDFLYCRELKQRIAKQVAVLAVGLWCHGIRF